MGPREDACPRLAWVSPSRWQEPGPLWAGECRGHSAQSLRAPEP